MSTRPSFADLSFAISSKDCSLALTSLAKELNCRAVYGASPVLFARFLRLYGGFAAKFRYNCRW